MLKTFQVPFTAKQVSATKLLMELGFLQRKRACPQNETRLNPTIFSSQSPKQGADFNYLRFALLCRSDNLEKVRDLFNEMKEKCVDVKLIQEVVKLYAKHELTGEVIDIIVDFHQNKKLRFNFFDLIPAAQVLPLFYSLASKITIDMEHYYCCLKSLLASGLYEEVLVVTSFQKQFSNSDNVIDTENRLEAHPLILLYEFYAMLALKKFSSFSKALTYLISNRLANAKLINELYTFFESKLVNESIELIFSLSELDLRNLTKDIIQRALQKLLHNGDTGRLCVILQSLVVNSSHVPTEYYIEILRFMIKTKCVLGVEYAITILQNLGITPPSGAYNFLLKSYLYLNQTHNYHSLISRINRDKIELNMEGYDIFFEEKFMRRDLRGSILLWRQMAEHGVLPSKYSFRVMAKLCVKFRNEAVLINVIHEAEVAGLPVDVYAFNSLLTLYCSTYNQDKIDQTLGLMEDLRIDPSAATFHRLIRYYLKSRNMEKLNAVLSSPPINGIELDHFIKSKLNELATSGDAIDEEGDQDELEDAEVQTYFHE